ncbi:hypothetical protein D3C87_1131130 [compost metagenome]
MKKFLIILSALQFITIGVLVYFRTHETISPEDKAIKEQAKINVDLDVKDLNKKLDQQGMQHLIMSDRTNVIESTKQLNDTSQKQIDSLTKQLNIKEKQLKEWVQYAVTVRDSFMTAKKENDTSFRASNKWANFQFVIPANKDKEKYFNYSYNAEINYAKYWQKKTFLSSKKDYIDFWLNDPNATVNGVKRVKIEAANRSRLEVNAVGLYHKNSLNTGFEGTFKKDRFSIGAGGVYDMNEKQWNPIVIAKFKILDF